MDILTIAIVIFAVLETSNVIMLYFTPGTKRGNGAGVFNAYEKSKSDPQTHSLIKYLINWVAGTKLIFIALLVVILFTGSELTKLCSVGALILSISSYFWRLHPLIKKMDGDGNISPKGYSKTLGIMILCFMLVFTAALAVALVRLRAG